jgi:hypothetical protein
MAVTLFFIDGDAGVTFGVTKPTEAQAVAAVYRKIKTDEGPLSVEPKTLTDLADAVADAFGGECGIACDMPISV